MSGGHASLNAKVLTPCHWSGATGTNQAEATRKAAWSSHLWQLGSFTQGLQALGTRWPQKTSTAQSLVRDVAEAGKKESIHRLAPVQNFSSWKKSEPQRKDFCGRYGFPGFHRVFVSTTAGLESFLWGQKSSQKDFLSVLVVCTFFFSAEA